MACFYIAEYQDGLSAIVLSFLLDHQICSHVLMQSVCYKTVVNRFYGSIFWDLGLNIVCTVSASFVGK